MKKFIVLFKQSGGCDYTIGCGLRWEFIDAKDKNAAVKKAIKEWGGDFDAGHEMSFHQFDLYEVTTYVNLGPLAAAANEKEERKQQAAAQAKKEAREKAELKRLQAKYGK